MSVDLRCGDYREALADVASVDCIISDPPYSARTDKGYRSATDYSKDALTEWRGKDRRSKATRARGGGNHMPRQRFELQYPPIDQEWVAA